MKRKITSVIAAVLVGSMIIGSTAFAADSSTTSNTESSSVTDTTVVAPLETQEVKEGRTMFAVPNAKGEGVASVGSTRLTVSYSQCTLPGAIETAVAAPANEGATQALEAFAASNFPGRKIAVKAKLRLYKAGQSVRNGFGTVKESFGVGNGYDGQNAEVVQFHDDGTITTTTVPVVNGKVSIDLTDMGTFFVIL